MFCFDSTNLHDGQLSGVLLYLSTLRAMIDKPVLPALQYLVSTFTHFWIGGNKFTLSCDKLSTNNGPSADMVTSTPSAMLVPRPSVTHPHNYVLYWSTMGPKYSGCGKEGA